MANKTKGEQTKEVNQTLTTIEVLHAGNQSGKRRRTAVELPRTCAAGEDVSTFSSHC